jgi:hypothetical protein
MLTKLYQLKEESLAEKEEIRRMWEQHLEKRIKEERALWEKQLYEIQQINEDLKVNLYKINLKSIYTYSFNQIGKLKFNYKKLLKKGF